MLPIHIFAGSSHYVLVRAGMPAITDAERLEPWAAHAVMAEALRRPTTHLVRDLGALLGLRGEDLERIISQTLVKVATPNTPSTLVLYRAKRRAVFVVNRSSEQPEEEEHEENEIQTHWIEVKLVDEDSGEPIPNARYEIELPNGQLRTGRLDEGGMARLDDIPPGECKVSFPDYADPDEAGEAEEDEPEPPLPVNTCEILSFELECQNIKKRKYDKLELPTRQKSDTFDVQTIEVVGARKGEGNKIAFNTVMLGAKCGEHAAKGVEVVRPRPYSVMHFAEPFGTFEAYYGDINVLEWLWPWRLEPVEYRVVPVTCDANRRHTASIRVYPAYEINLKAAVLLDATKRSSDKLKKARVDGFVERRGRPAHTEWKIEAEGAINYGSRKIALGGAIEGKLRDLRAVNLWIKRGIELFCKIFKDFFGLDLELILPNLALELVGKYIELESRQVSREWSLAFKADPLLGLAIKADILDLTIAALEKFPALTGVMRFFKKVRELAADSGNKLEFIAKLTGKIGFELKGSKDKSKELVEVGAHGIGEVDIGFEATAEVSVGVMWFVSFEAGASIKGATGIQIKPGALSDDDGIALTCDLILKPCKFEYGAYASGKFSWSKKKDKSGGKPGVGGSKTFWDEKKLLEGKKYVVTYDGETP